MPNPIRRRRLMAGASALAFVLWNFQFGFPTQLTYDGASPTTFRNAAGLNQFKQHQLLENAKMSDQNGDPLVPSGWGGSAGTLTYEDEGGYFKATSVAAADQAWINNAVTVVAGEKYTYGCYMESTTFSGNESICILTGNAGGSEHDMVGSDFTTAGWYLMGFIAGDTSVVPRIGAGSGTAKTGTVVFSRPFFIKGWSVGVSDTAALRQDGPPLGLWIGTDDGDEPRFDIPRIGAYWDAGSGAYNAGWLRTPGYTNFLWPSEDASAHSLTRFTVDDDAVTAPDGQDTADTLLETTHDDTHHLDYTVVAADTSTVYSGILWLKKNVNRYAEIQMETDGTTVTAGAIFDFDIGAFVSSTGGVKLTELEPWPNGVFRVGVQLTTPGDATQVELSVWGNTDGSSHQHSYAGNTSNGVTVWGAQINKGGFPPYVPTVLAAVASAAETAFDGVSGVPLTYINYLHSTFIITATPLPGTLGDGTNRYLFEAAADALAADKPQIEIFNAATPAGRVFMQYVLAGSTPSWRITTASNTAGARHKYSATYGDAGGLSAFDGVDGTTEPAFTPEPGFDKVAVGTTFFGSAGYMGFIEQVKIPPVFQTQAQITAETVL